MEVNTFHSRRCYSRKSNLKHRGIILLHLHQQEICGTQPVPCPKHRVAVCVACQLIHLLKHNSSVHSSLKRESVSQITFKLLSPAIFIASYLRALYRLGSSKATRLPAIYSNTFLYHAGFYIFSGAVVIFKMEGVTRIQAWISYLTVSRICVCVRYVRPATANLFLVNFIGTRCQVLAKSLPVLLCRDNNAIVAVLSYSDRSLYLGFPKSPWAQLPRHFSPLQLSTDSLAAESLSSHLSTVTVPWSVPVYSQPAHLSAKPLEARQIALVNWLRHESRRK